MKNSVQKRKTSIKPFQKRKINFQISVKNGHLKKKMSYKDFFKKKLNSIQINKKKPKKLLKNFKKDRLEAK